MATRRELTKTTITVEHRAEPMGRARENGPHLWDLREFVKVCEGLPDNALVRIRNGHMGESGRHDVTISLAYDVPDADTFDITAEVDS